MYGQAMGAQIGAVSPEELAQQQARWEKERVENVRTSYQGQLAHAALMLLAGNAGTELDAASALELAHDVLQGAKKYTP